MIDDYFPTSKFQESIAAEVKGMMTVRAGLPDRESIEPGAVYRRRGGPRLQVRFFEIESRTSLCRSHRTWSAGW